MTHEAATSRPDKKRFIPTPEKNGTRCDPVRRSMKRRAVRNFDARPAMRLCPEYNLEARDQGADPITTRREIVLAGNALDPCRAIGSE
jgi:hypothetical protein